MNRQSRQSRQSIRRVAALRAAFVLVTLLGNMAMVATPAKAQVAGDDTVAAEAGRFAAVEVYVEPGGRRLGAYQIEVRDPAGLARIVGIEGGDHPAFSEPPYYDPAALRHHRIILGAFSTASELPRARTRVATLHVHVTGTAPLALEGKLEVAVTPGGTGIPATVTLEGVEP